MAKISFHDLAHAYGPAPSKPEHWALKPMTMTLEDGGAYALLGPSGCGKTTLLNLTSGLLAPTKGRIEFDRVDVTLDYATHEDILKCIKRLATEVVPALN